jgi:hypothetical protein
MGAFFASGFLILAVTAAAIVLLAGIASGGMSVQLWGWQFALGAQPKYAVLASALAASLTTLLLVSILRRALAETDPPSPSLPRARLSVTDACLLFVAAWLLIVLPLAALTHQLALFPMSLSLPAATTASPRPFVPPSSWKTRRTGSNFGTTSSA